MKVIWEFDPDNPEDSEKLKLYQKALPMNLVLWDFAQHLRNKLKYESLPDEVVSIYEEIQKEFFELLLNHSIELG